MVKRVLIVHATGGMGHVTAANAVEQAFKNKYPQLAVTNVDIIDFAAPWYRRIFVDGYNWISAHFPAVWGWLYRTFNSHSRQSLPNFISRRAVLKQFITYVQKQQPDFIITTHPLPTYLIAQSTGDDMIQIPSSIVVTDFGCHSWWVNKEVNYYFVATDAVGRCLAQYGVTADQVIVTGIPISRKFIQPQQRPAVMKKLGLQPTAPTVLIVGGQFIFSELQKIITDIEAAVTTVQFLVVAGRDKQLEAKLHASNLDQRPHIKIFGFVDTMPELMTAADLIFSKAGGLTVSECMAKGLPMVIYKVIPGQEEDNVRYLVGHGAAVRAESVAAIATTVIDILNNQKKLTAMKTAAQKIGRPNSAVSLADFVYQTIS